MLQLYIDFPNINPEIFAIDLFGFHLAIRWYSLAYIAGIILAWRLMLWVVKRPSFPFKNIDAEVIDDFITYAIISIIVGGRLFGTLVYNWDYYSQNPLEVIMPPYAGMSFHGGFLGIIVAVAYVAWKHKISLRAFADLCALVAPFGLFFGRIANFINAELWGRVTDVPWAVLFPAESLPRHPSQLYEAALEGVLLAIILWSLYFGGALRKTGLATGVFFVGYGLARIFVEFFREPDQQFASYPDNPVGYAIQFGQYGLTMGQLLSIPMLLIGLYFLLTISEAEPKKPISPRRKKTTSAKKALSSKAKPSTASKSKASTKSKATKEKIEPTFKAKPKNEAQS